VLSVTAEQLGHAITREAYWYFERAMDPLVRCAAIQRWGDTPDESGTPNWVQVGD